MEMIIAFALSYSLIIAGLLVIAKSRRDKSARTDYNSHHLIDDYHRHTLNHTQKLR